MKKGLYHYSKDYKINLIKYLTISPTKKFLFEIVAELEPQLHSIILLEPEPCHVPTSAPMLRLHNLILNVKKTALC
jgi:hypothetical protein